MTRSWSENTDLVTMQNDLAALISAKARYSIRLLEVISLTPEDYQFLTQKLRCIQTVEEIEYYTLSLIVAWIQSFHFHQNQEMRSFAESIFKSLPQHHTKYILESISLTLHDYQIDHFGLKLTSLDDLEKIVKCHAGLLSCDAEYT